MAQLDFSLAGFVAGDLDNLFLEEIAVILEDKPEPQAEPVRLAATQQVADPEPLAF